MVFLTPLSKWPSHTSSKSGRLNAKSGFKSPIPLATLGPAIAMSSGPVPSALLACLQNPQANGLPYTSEARSAE